MTSCENNNITTLIGLLKAMYVMVASNSNSDVEYGKKTIIQIVQFLEKELTDNTLEYVEIVSMATKRYKSMFPPKGGLSDFHIWDNDYEIRYKANLEYEQIKAQIEEMLNTEKIL